MHFKHLEKIFYLVSASSDNNQAFLTFRSDGEIHIKDYGHIYTAERTSLCEAIPGILIRLPMVISMMCAAGLNGSLDL